MATVSVLTSTRMLAIEAESIVGGTVNGTGHLILTRHDGTTIDAGNVVGPQGIPGPADVNSVKITTDQTIAGVKTFSSAPVVPAASFPESAIINLVADLASAVHLTGAETIAGVKTFSSAPVVPAGSFPESAIANLVADLASAVHLTGAETIAGAKTFSSQIIASASARMIGDNFYAGRSANGAAGARLHITTPSALVTKLISEDNGGGVLALTIQGNPVTFNDMSGSTNLTLTSTDPISGYTAITSLRVNYPATGLTIVPVSFGAADSGGPGLRALCIPNAP